MKTLVLSQACLLSLIALSDQVHGQGQIGIVNRALGSGLDAPIYDVDCQTPLFGPSYVAQGFIGLSPESLEPVFPLIQFFPDDPRAGYVMPTLVTVDGGGARFFQLRVWEAAAGNSYEAAVAAGGKHGVSNISPVEAVFPPGGPGVPTGLQSFCLVPEPSTVVLLLGGGLMLLFRFPRRRETAISR